MKRIGIRLGGIRSSAQMIEYARLAEESGFESVWVAEHLFGRDAFPLLAVLAIKTKRVRLSTSIVNIYSRSPVHMAATVATIDELSDGRAMLGIGTGNTTLLWKIGVKTRNHLSNVKDYTRIVRGLLEGKTITYGGEMFNIHEVKIGFRLSGKSVPIYLAAVRPNMLQLVGEIGDGVVFSAHSSCGYVKNALEDIKIGAEKVGKRLDDVDKACLIATFVSENSQAAKAATKEAILRALSSPGIFSDPFTWELMFGPENSYRMKRVREALQKGDMITASKHMTSEMVDMITVSGQPEECKKRLDEFVSAGVTLPIVSPISGSDLAMTIKTFSQTYLSTK